MASLRLKIPPVAAALLAGAMMWLLGWTFPELHVWIPGRRLLMWALGLVAAFVGAAGVAAVVRARTTVDPMHPEKASTLVTTGVYRRTRNPMYLGLLLLLAAYATHLTSPLAVLVLPLFILYMNRFQIAPEEEALAARFGGAFAEYRRHVRRWI